MAATVTAMPETPTQPFGLPMGSIRGIMSLLICGFFWVVLLWPAGQPATVVLAHFFLLGLVMMAFASHHHLEAGSSAFLPWLLRVLFVGGSAAVVALALVRDPALFQHRLTPPVEEIQIWWVPFLCTMFGGFAFGLFLRFILGRASFIFMTIRAWLSVVGMVMLAVEIAMVFAFASAENKSIEFLHYWDCVELVIVSAYFGTRA